MTKSDSRRVFEKNELYNLCAAEVSALRVEEESRYKVHWSTFIDDELEEVYQQLSESGKEEFNEQLIKVGKQFKEEFENLPENVNDEETYEFFVEMQEELMYRIVEEMQEFLIE